MEAENLENNNNFHRTVPTSAITFIESEHGRERRRQRGIDKKDLQNAMKYGMKEIQDRTTVEGHPTTKYTYKDITYIVDEVTGREITSYAVPIILDLIPLTEVMIQDHQHATENLRQNPTSWTSNTVLVVDTSGSMKEGDVWGARNRLSAVWLTIALDFIAHRLESGMAGPTDVISIVALGENPKSLILDQPTTWVLYNQVASIYNETTPCQALGHGPYLNSLALARRYLERNPSSSCAACLMFLSDGRPSNEKQINYKIQGCSKDELILEHIEELAKVFGRRMTFQAVGIGDYKEFGTLQNMVNKANDYGVSAQFCLPSMSTSGLGEAFTTLATYISCTQYEMTNVITKKQESIRDVFRESKNLASQRLRWISSHKFSIFPLSIVRRLMYVENKIEIHQAQDGKKWKSEKKYHQVPLQHPDSQYIAVAKEAFGEGAERFAFRFYELSSDAKTIVGKAMVAKENRFDGMDTEQGLSHAQFVNTSCATQQLARRLANEFNQKLRKIRRISSKTPIVSFLDCSIYEIDEGDGRKKKLFVEDRLDHNKWQKWNSNNGHVEGMSTTSHDMMKRLCDMKDMTIIEEKEEAHMMDKSENMEDYDVNMKEEEYDSILFTPNEVAQAFSHFTYWATGRKRLVCDLQGVYDDILHELQLSDPVIHYYNPSKYERRYVHGRTDKGYKGMRMFFETHTDYCGLLCKLVLRGLRCRPVSNQEMHK